MSVVLGRMQSMTLSFEDPRLTPIALRKELLDNGHSERSIAQALRTGVLARPRRGAYVDGNLWKGLSEEDRYAVRCRAAYRQSKTDVVLSHVSAVPFRNGPLWGLDLAEVHLSRPDHRTGRREAGVRQHSGKLLELDVVTENGLLLTSPERTAVEVTTVAPVVAALGVVNDLLHRQITTLERVKERYELSMEHWPNSLSAQVVLRLADPRVESLAESLFVGVAWMQSLPMPIPQYEVIDSEGKARRLDFALPEFGVWFEIDGKVKYEQPYRIGDTAADVVFREKRRQDRISEATGWRCMRITWADLQDPVRLAARIRAFLESSKTPQIRRSA
ncbi:hypothetical protein [Nocardioides sp.]|uniref:hypothetical protein n=1 Tax=Nocardioides sp. TaxID=35761 RepID=UPI001991A990|nr:hypothetical protein [Nocardioides sp.]MBC7278357.1 hypothetical protein [Nocardioides sp.]